MSLIEIVKSKIHRATITKTDLHYAGSITIDRDLMDAAGLYAYEKVQVLNINTGARFETYVIEGKRGEREISLNGAAARLAQQGDRIIIIAYTLIEESAAAAWKPSIITLDSDNNPL